MNPSLTLALPFQLALPSWMLRFAYVFAEDDDKGGDDNRDDDAFSDDLDNAFGDDDKDDDKDDDDADDTDDDDEDKDEDDEEDDDDKKSKSDKKDSSAIHQKKRYRDLYTKTKTELEAIKAKEDGGQKLTEDEKKEQAAKEFLAKNIREVLHQIESEKSQTDIEKQETFDTELEEVLDENPKVKEDDLLKITEELGVTPKQAFKILQREKGLTKREKPKVPKEKRASTKVDTTDMDKKEERLTLDSINKRIKEGIKKGSY